MEKKSALAVMLKPPRPGEVKTRLSPPLTPDEACRLYECFIRDTFASVSRLNGADVFAAVGRSSSSNRILRKDPASELIPPGVTVFPQKGQGLGERIKNVFIELFKKGYAMAAVIGSDSPDIPLEYIKEAFTLLAGPSVDMVLGPATDGGYYLIAAKAPVKGVFKGTRWSTPFALEDTVKAARRRSLRLRFLPPWHDIDRPSDLALIRHNGAARLSACYLRSLSGC